MEAEAPGNRVQASYSLRHRQLAPSTMRLVEEGLEAYGLSAVLPRFANARIQADIGCGSGSSTEAAARAYPHDLHVAVEVFPPGIAALIRRIRREGLDNVAIACAEAAAGLPELFAEQSVSVFRIYYPDPWPKRRHRKRRMVDEPFLRMLANLAAPDALLHFVSDHPDYARSVRNMCLAGKWQEEPGSDDGMHEHTRYANKARGSGRASMVVCLRRAQD